MGWTVTSWRKWRAKVRMSMRKGAKPGLDRRELWRALDEQGRLIMTELNERFDISLNYAEKNNAKDPRK